MGTTIDKLNKVLETKNNIKSAIINKGVEVNDSDTFASYAEKIGEITTGHPGEMINISLKTDNNNNDVLNGTIITLSYGDIIEHYEWNGNELTLEIPQYAIYTVSASDVYSYMTPNSVTNTAVSTNSRMIIMEYEWVPSNSTTIRLNMTITDPSTMITGDINGPAIQSIRSNSHRYLGKYTSEGQMTICQLDDADSNLYYDGTSALLDGSHGDVFMKLPRFYYKAIEYSKNIWDISFVYGGEVPGSTWKIWDGNDLIGAYQCVLKDDLAYSITGETEGSLSYLSWKPYCHNRGAGYSMVKFKHFSIMCFLFYALYGNTDSQSICGSGTDDYTKSAGATNSLGMEDTTENNGNSMSINFWGLENWWGNRFEWIDNVEFTHDSEGTTMIITEDNGDIRTISLTTNVNDYQIHYNNVLLVGDYLDAVPIEHNGSATTGMCDTGWIISSHKYLMKNSYDNEDAGGVSSFLGSSGYSNAYTGARLAFRGNILIETNTATFKNIAITN